MPDLAPDPDRIIYIGIDDTDIVGSPGTNQLARALVQSLADRTRLLRITRHQLLDDPRVPYTSQNGSASILLTPLTTIRLDEVFDLCQEQMQKWFIEGSDPGLCVSDHVPDAVVAWGELCKQSLVEKAEALALARDWDIRLKGLGGTHGGVIGALAAVGLARDGNDGRIVMWQTWPDDLSGEVSVSAIREREIDVVDADSKASRTAGVVNVGKHLRPNIRSGRATLWVVQDEAARWTALKLK